MSSSTSPLAAAATTTEETTTESTSLLDQIVSSGRFNRDAQSLERGRDLVKEFVSQVLDGSMTLSKDAEVTITARLAQIDRLISLQLNEVMHHPAFQKLEATWRGIKYLMDQSETNDGLKLKVLNVSKKELLDLRTRLSDLRGTLQGNDKLDAMLFEAVSSTEAREKLKGELAEKKEGGE